MHDKELSSLTSVFSRRWPGASTGKQGKVRSNGLGVYALGPEDTVHWTEAHPLVTAESQASVLNSFGYFWKQRASKRIWLEKSPPNLHMGRFLQALFNLGLGNKWDVGPGVALEPLRSSSAVKFIWISRHPIANALAHRALPECADLSVKSLVKHWVVAHEYANADLPYLADVKQLTLEAFVTEPLTHLTDLWAWLGLEPDPKQEELKKALARRVRRDPNAKYRGSYCRQALGSPSQARDHQRLVKELNPRVTALSGLGYDLDEWPCLAGVASLAKQAKQGQDTKTEL
mmetsp:Transcript_45738/g.103280  ORF Transcript_45738/g.103280 Transcript_45738/m.103280 type:complete len:288 (+) Transcript_45738:22-885(+)